MESKEEKLDKRQKYQLILALIVTALLAVVVGTQAWLTYVRRLQTAAVVDMPNLIIQGPLDSDTAPLELGDIDVTNGNSRQYVFSITATNASGYKLQLAHTTNIPFTYTIYKAQLSTNETSGIHIGNFWYDYKTEGTGKLSGEYLNLDDETKKADHTYHDQTYGGYRNVQQNAEPLYWQSDSVKVQSHETGIQRDYYVLDISWNENLKNNKETDMVYLTVEAVELGSTGQIGGSE